MFEKILKITLANICLAAFSAFAQDESIEHFEQPRILESRTQISQDFEVQTMIYVNTDLNLKTVEQHIGTGTFPIIIHPSKGKNIFGYKIESIEAVGTDYSEESERCIYIIKGTVCEDLTCSKNRVLYSGDSLSFNVKIENMEGFNDIGFALESEDLYIKSKNDIPATKLAWAKNVTTIPTIAPIISQFTNVGNFHIIVAGNSLVFGNLPSSAKVQVYNILGRKQRTSNLAKGLYFVKVNDYIFKIPIK